MFTIYIDMDGVVADFDSAFGPYRPWNDENVQRFVDDRGFENLGALPGASLIREMISEFSKTTNIVFLSSMGGYANSRIYTQKRRWLDNNRFYGVPLIAVLHKGLKKDFATPNAILIDDTNQNIYDWRENHGLACHVVDKSGFSTKNYDQIQFLMRTLKNNYNGFVYTRDTYDMCQKD